MITRGYQPEDCSEIIQLFYDTVHTINLRDYSQEQIDVWAPTQIDHDRWNRTLQKNHTIIVEFNNTIVGFGDIDDTGYFDHLYVHKAYQGQSVATRIANEIEQYAKSRGIKLISTHSSITARPFFEQRGYQVITHQSVKRGNQVLTNFIMEKRLEE
ncbi:MAG: GNAT family N-acetyltransferase [Oscillospiraceae bacterium]